MENSGFLLGSEKLNKLFPFYFILDRNLKIKNLGTSLIKLIPNKDLDSFQQNFELKRPNLDLISFTILLEDCREWVWLEIKNPNKNALRGQFEYLEKEDLLLFVGSPFFDSFDNLKKNNLSLDDFAFHDPQIDLLHISKNQEIINNELKDLLGTIHNQKKALKKANKDVQDLALFSQENPDPLFRIENTGEILLLNPAAEQLSLIEFENIKYPIRDFWRHVSKSINPGTSQWSIEVKAENRILSFVCVNIEDQAYFNVYGRDVTNRRRNQEEILRLSLVASANVSGVLFTHANGKIFWVNGGFTQLTGYRFHDVYGKTPVEVFKGALTDRDSLKKMIRSFENQEPFSVELIHYKKDGSWFWGRAKGQSYLTTDGETVQYFAMIEDITLEKEKEERLRTLSQIAENNFNAVIIYDTEGRINWVNKSFTDMTGFTLEEVWGKLYSEILKGPKTDPSELDRLGKAIRNGESFNGEWQQSNKYGKFHWVKIIGQTTHNKKGEITGFFSLHEDITLERETQAKLRESEARFRIALEKIGDEVWELDFRNEKAPFNRKFNLSGSKNRLYNREYFKKRWSRVYEPDVTKLETTFDKYISGEIDSHNIEYRIITHENHQKWILDRGVVIERDENNLPLRVIGTHTDITKIKKTEIKLEQRVKQFQSLSENIPGVIYEYEFRPDGTEGLRYVSPAMERVFRIKPENFYDYLSYISMEDQARILEKNKASRDTLEPFYDESQLHIPGVGTRWHAIHSSFSYISEKNAKVFTGFMMDITERKNIEDTLRANEEKYRGIIDNMQLGLLEVDKQGAITYANRGFENISGFSLNELIGKTISEMTLYIDNENSILRKEVYDSPESKGAVEIKVRTKDLKSRWWLASRAPRFDSHQNHVGSIGIYLDITDQKNLENQLIESRREAERSAQSKEIFLANMSHEIRTPMNAIMGMSHQLTKSTLNEQQKFYLDTILSSAENLLVILNDILDISKIEAGKLSIESIGFEPQKVIERSIQVLSHKAEEKGIQLYSSYFDPNISDILIGDPYRLNQVMINLISNSVKFTEKGSVVVNVQLMEDTDNSQLLEIEVADTGIGMDEDFVEHLFDKFSQEYESTTRKFGGTGLGMSICKQLIGLMGGEILVKSRKGIGTHIFVQIKFLKGKLLDLPVKNNSEIEADFLIGKKILITDDNHLNRLVASITLENFKADIEEAVNGKQALELVKNNRYDIILMDIQMPEMNGLECTRLIRELGIQTPIIALTAQAIKGEIDKCLKAGMNDYLSKPFKEEDLLKMIDHQLQNPSPLTKFPSVETTESSEKDYDLTNLKAISRGNEVFIKKMVGIFLNETPPVVVEMLEAYQNQELERMGKLAHKIKPSIDNLNINRIKTTIRSIEGAGKENKNSLELSIWIHEVDQTIQNVLSGMKIEFPDLFN